MLYHNGTTQQGTSPVSFFGDLVDPAPLRAALDEVASLAELCDTEILSSFAQLERASRLVDALKLRLFQEIAERSPVEGPSLARDHGHKDAIDLLVRLTGSSRPDVRARLELASVLPVAEPAWASSSPGFPDQTDPDASGDLPPPSDGTDPSDPTGPTEPASPEPLFSYVEKGIRSGELPSNTAQRIKQEITKLQRETTNTTPEQILHAEKLLVAYAIGAEIPDDPSKEFVLDFDFGLTPSTTSPDTPDTPPPPARSSRPNLPIPSSGVGRAATNVLKKIAPTSKRVEKTQMARRCVKIGPTVNGLVQITGWVLPEVAALIQRAFDVILSPRTAQTEDLGKAGAFDTSNGTKNTGVRFTKTDAEDAGPGLTVTDDRTPDQKRHDAFAALMEAALKAGHLPQTANAAATLVVTISEEELDKPDGTGRMIDHFGKETPITARTARHTACNGKVMLMRQTRTGRIVDLENYQRVFTEHQRKAIIARDGGCVIPGCDVPAGWCEIHHVIPWSENGPTSTDNGVAVCWWHHRTIETSGWDIRMRAGIPEIKAPPGIDPQQKWRQARPRVPEHAMMLNRGSGTATESLAQATASQQTASQATVTQKNGEPFDLGTFQTEEPF